jgi:hypothetical protein
LQGLAHIEPGYASHGPFRHHSDISLSGFGLLFQSMTTISIAGLGKLLENPL